MEQHGPETMFVKDAFDALKACTPELANLKVRGTNSEETEARKELLVSRMNIIVGFVNQNRALVRANLASQRNDLKIASVFVETYWSNIHSFNQKTINARLKLMFNELESSPRLKSALQAVGLYIFVEELIAVDQNLNRCRESIRKTKAAMPKVNLRQIKSSVGEKVTDLIYAIELALKAHPELDYMPMINEINLLFASYQSDIKARSTRSKNAATTEATTETVAPAETLAAAV